mgnify:CR=1 FL=1|tara:strand:+ start:9518 stop:10129 length:612 start_codon:yes stop_codon:yes gene_type:complete
MSRLFEGVSQESIPAELTDIAMALEALAEEGGGGEKLYVLLTDTNTRFSQLAKKITKNPYNHASLSFDADLENIYTYHLRGGEGTLRGGLKKESLDVLRGSRYSLYELSVTSDAYEKVMSKVKEMESSLEKTGYYHLGLINAIFNKRIFESEVGMRMFCSQFIVEVLKAADIELFKNRHSSTVRPYDFVKSKLLRFVRRGTFR